MAAPFAKKLYNSKPWKQCRDAYKAYRHGICERCGQPGEEVHHKKHLTPANINDPDIVYGWKNLELLCRNCHIEEHEKKHNLGRLAREADIRYMFDEQGNPIPRGRVRIVWGAPASGKSTYVQLNRQHMDIVIDLDEIMRCFCGLDTKQDDPKRTKDYLPFALLVRDAMYKLCQGELPGVCTVWIVAGLPRREDRQQLSVMFPDAQFIHIETTCDEALARADRDDHRWNKERMEKIILEYFRNYEPDLPPVKN